MDLSALRASARSKADEEATGFISDTALDRFINEGNRFLYNKVVSSYEDYFVTEGTSGNSGLISVTASTQSYSLPATMQKLCWVEYRASGDTNDDNWLPLDRVMGADRKRMAGAFYPPREGYPGGRFGYFIAGDKIYFRPVPRSAFSARLWFIPKATTLSSSSDTPTTPEEFHELIADFAALRILGKSGDSIFKEMTELFNLQLATFMESVGHRVHEPQQMIITDDYEHDRWSF